MKHFYYVVEKQLQSNSEVEETNGWKTIRVYRIVNDEMSLIDEFDLELHEPTEESVDEMLYDESYIAIGEQVKLIQL